MQHVNVGSADSGVAPDLGIAGAGNGVDSPARSPVDAATIALAAGRALFAVGMFVVPGRAATLWLGGDPSPIRRHVMRLLAVRDLVLSAGTLLSGRRRPWLLASATADAGDAVASVVAAAVLRRARPLMVAGLAVGGTVSGAVLAAERSVRPIDHFGRQLSNLRRPP
jgi:hypothetical protein